MAQRQAAVSRVEVCVWDTETVYLEPAACLLADRSPAGWSQGWDPLDCEPTLASYPFSCKSLVGYAAGKKTKNGLDPN